MLIELAKSASLYIDWIVIPLTAGIVGYVTNSIAIHMLFRPFKPHWYTLGWQGIVPRTRSALAANVANLVGEKLVTEQEIKLALQSEELRDTLHAAVHRFISQSNGQAMPLQYILQTVCDKLTANESLRNSLDTYSANVLHKVIAAILSLQCRTISSWMLHASESDTAQVLIKWLRHYAEQEAKKAINTFVHSGKSLADLSEGMISSAELAPIIAEQLSPMLRSLLSRPVVLDRLSGMLITYKDEQLAGHMFKRAAANAFLSDEKIVSLVRDKVPDLANDIAADTALRNDITAIIEQKLHELFHKPLHDYAIEKPDNYQKFLQTSSAMLVAKALPDSAVKRIASLAMAYDGMSLREAINTAGIEIDELLPTSIPLSRLLLSGELQGFKGVIGNASLSQSQQNTLITAITDWLLQLFKGFAPLALSHIKIVAIVEEKINSLDVKDVENMLFSFMGSHFRWINALGFLIGFIMGLGQMLFIKLFN